MPHRPSDKELFAKVQEALAAIHEGHYQFLDDPHLVASLDDLGLENEDALVDLIVELLETLKTSNLQECYAGGRPPQKSYEPSIRNLDLWAFKCYCGSQQRIIYLKFTLKKGIYIHISCHEDEP